MSTEMIIDYSIYNTIKTAGNLSSSLIKHNISDVPDELYEELKERMLMIWNKLDLDEKAYALAAPQVGLPYKMFMIRDIEAEEKYCFCTNPVSLLIGKKFTNINEGCLSFPGKFFNTLRFEAVELKCRENLEFKKYTGLQATVLQHEMEHLAGKTIYDSKTEQIYEQKISRNALCLCKSGLKYKKCCGKH